VVGHLGNVQATHAQASAVVGVLGVALALDELAVLVRVQQDTTAIVAARARPCATAGDGQAVLLVTPGVLVRDFNVVADELRRHATVVVALHSMFCHNPHSSLLAWQCLAMLQKQFIGTA